MQAYELVLILDPKEKEESKKKILAKIEGWLKRKGKLVRQENWGKKLLAYPLKSGKSKLQEGEYFQIDFEAEAGLVVEIGKKLKLEEEVIRYLFVRKQKKEGG